LPPQHQRKRNISLDLLTTAFEGSDDAELADRAKRYLRTLIKYGLDEFEDGVGSVVRHAGCACARSPIDAKARNKQYDFGKDRCSKAGGSCRIGEFLIGHRQLIEKILGDLRALPVAEKTAELSKTEAFLVEYLDDLGRSAEGDPCLNVGDLLIALESTGVAAFYTLNHRESVHLCRSVGQTLVYRPVNPERGDVVCPLAEPDWRSLIAARVTSREVDVGATSHEPES
jgi:hypothetical protein